MLQYWTFSGINSYDESRGQLVDYVSETLAARGVQSNPDRHYVSALGTGRYYAGPQQVLGFQSEAKLDQEARDFASGASGLPAIAPGMFQGKRVLAMLVAPKTTTEPPRDPRLDVSIYWSPNDAVPNQGLFRPDTYNYWNKFTRGRACLYVIHNISGSLLSRAHAFREFMRPNPTTMRRGWRRTSKTRRRRIWQASRHKAPTGPKLVSKWLSWSSVDYVMVGHSQGVNIMMHCLEQGYSS